ncbi:MAG: hypothetical protein H7A32_02930 [Deltaproteobacteria bacterium]|nr:hypothetical protein [Deltaproteobacteria bacterium]
MKCYSQKRSFTNFLQKYILVIFSALFLVSCGRGCLQENAPTPKKETVQEKVSDFELIPKDLNVVAGMNMSKVLSSPIGSKIQDKIPIIAKPFINELDEVSFAWKAKELGRGPEKILGILSGKFDLQKVEERLNEYSKKNQEKYQIEDYKNHKLYYFQEKPAETLSIVAQKVVIGHKDLVMQVVDLSQQEAEQRKANSILSQKDLLKQIKSIDTKKMLWFAAIVPEGKNTDDPTNSSSIQAVDLTMDFPDELHFELGLTTHSESEAKEMESQALSYQILFGKRLAQQDPAFAKAIEGIKIMTDSNRLIISFTLNQEQIKSLEKMKLEP